MELCDLQNLHKTWNIARFEILNYNGDIPENMGSDIVFSFD